MRYIVSKLEQPCKVCGRLTDLFELDLEVRICSEKCYKKVKESNK